MIERLIKNDLTLKRYRRFKRNKIAVFSLLSLGVLIFFSVTANFWSNSKPLIMKHNGSIYFPVLKTYHPTVFGIEDEFVTEYKKLKLISDADWKLWPINKWDPLESNNALDSFPAPPSAMNWFGTDDRGRDIFARLLYGFRYSFGFALMVWLLSYFIGIVAGAVMGFMGGWVDLIGQRVVEIIESLPGLIMLITLVSVFGASMKLLVIFSALLGWMGISYYVRAEFLKLRRLEFVEAAKSIGGGKFRQIFKHILPNSLGPVITFSPFIISSSISSLAALDYLGFGLPAPTPSWGELLQQAQKNFTIAWWLAVFPSIALFISLLVMNLIGDGVRDAFDPRNA